MKILNNMLPTPALKNLSLNKGIAIILIILLKALTRTRSKIRNSTDAMGT